MKKWTFYAGAIVVLVLLIARGGLAAMSGVIRFLLPAAVVYLGYRMVRQMLLPGQKSPPNKRMPQPPVIEICPECGVEKGPGHTCAPA